MDKYVIWMAVLICLLVFGWLYVNTYQVHEYTSKIENYESRIDSLESKVGKLEYFVENEPKQIIINVNESKTQK